MLHFAALTLKTRTPCSRGISILGYSLGPSERAISRAMLGRLQSTLFLGWPEGSKREVQRHIVCNLQRATNEDRGAKVRFRGLKKNHDHLCTAFALVNLYLHRKRLDPLGA